MKHALGTIVTRLNEKVISNDNERAGFGDVAR